MSSEGAWFVNTLQVFLKKGNFQSVYEFLFGMDV